MGYGVREFSGDLGVDEEFLRVEKCRAIHVSQKKESKPEEKKSGGRTSDPRGGGKKTWRLSDRSKSSGGEGLDVGFLSNRP